HILPELASVCDAVGFMERGRLVACGTVQDVQRQVHPHRVIEIETLGDPLALEQKLKSLVPDGNLHGVDRLENLLRVQLEATDDEIARLLGSLVESGHAVLGFREIMSDLEEAF